MSSIKDRTRRGEEILKQYRSKTVTDRYAMAADAISDILLSVAQTHEEAMQLLQSAEMEFRNTVEAESFLAEG